MTNPLDPVRSALLKRAFRMPPRQTMASRKSSITNAFVSAIIPPVVEPTPEEIEQALAILRLDATDLRCAYCGDRFTEWDHLRPLVLNRRPTGYISEIANLVPACGKCNQSKGNQGWRIWMTSSARLSPTGRGLPDVASRIERLEEYERWKKPTRVDFVQILGSETWNKYWAMYDELIEELAKCQRVADEVQLRIAQAVSAGLGRVVIIDADTLEPH